MENVYVGKITTTHGIKGELKVRSDFKYKDEIFVPNMKIIVNGEELKIISSRNQMEYKLIILDGYNNIDNVIKFKNSDIYVSRNLINSNYILNEDIIGFEVYVGKKKIGLLDSIIKSQAHDILVVNKIMIPYVSAFVKNIDIKNKKIYINEVEGLL